MPLLAMKQQIGPAAAAAAENISKLDASSITSCWCPHHKQVDLQILLSQKPASGLAAKKYSNDQPSGSFLFRLDFRLAFSLSASALAGGFCSAVAEGSELSPLELGIFSYIIAESREYIRRAREGKVDDLTAAENDDQYHQSFLKYSVLIISSSEIVA
ncbi:hypothetical protein Ahy_A05g022531 isoform C [Arachis hypogaea]|uniref:Uncharacterized protein n=1 Tax=Arachis hypogaea TaxID=3818 RepID=A0A445D0S5_ARAHY|nr:hypothetical protein Ahy_A05g022531 isoform C [Arachis hypogaea]